MIPKTDLILLHGALADHRQFRELEPLLNDRYRIHSPNFSGHGQTEASSTSFSAAEFADELLKYMDQAGIEQARVFGYSMGGYVALIAALNQPERFHSVFTLATKYNWTPESVAQEVRFLDPDKIQAKVPKFAALLEKCHTSLGWRTVLTRTAEMMYSLGQTNPLFSGLGLIDLRVRVGVGDRDTTAGLADSCEAFARLPQGELEVFPNTPHPFEKVSLPRLVASIHDFFQ